MLARRQMIQSIKFRITNMGLFDFLFKSREQRKKDKRVNDLLKRTDKFIEDTEKMLDDMNRF